MTTTPTPPAEGGRRLRYLILAALVVVGGVVALLLSRHTEEVGDPTPAADTADAEPIIPRQRFSIRVRWSGATAAEVDQLVARPMVASLHGFEHIDRVELISRDGEAMAIVTLSKTIRVPEIAVTRDAALRRVATRLPAEAEIVALRGDATAPPEQLVALTSDRLTAVELGLVAARSVQPKLEALSGVTGVDLLGVTTPEVRVALDPVRLAALGLTVDAVVAAVREPTTTPSGGPGGSGIAALKDVTIPTAEGMATRLLDVADIALTGGPNGGVLSLDGHAAVGLAVHGDAHLTHEALVGALPSELPPSVELGWSAKKTGAKAAEGLFVSLRIPGDRGEGAIASALDRVEEAALRLPGGETALGWTRGPREATLLLRGHWPDDAAEAKAADALRDTLDAQAGVESRVAPLDARGFSPRPAPLRVEVTGQELEAVDTASARIGAALKKVTGVRSVWASESQVRERRVKIDRDKAKAAGVPPSALHDAVTLREAGLVVAQLRDGEAMIPVRLVLGGAAADRSVMVAGADGARVPLKDLVEVELRTGPDRIERGRRSLRATLDAEVSGREVDAVRADVTATLGALELPQGVQARLTE